MPGPGRRTLRWPLAALTLVPLALVPLVACRPPSDEEADRRTGCAAAVEEASQAVEVDEQVELLDRALLTCRSYDALAAELARHPGIIGYDIPTFVALRCTRVDAATRRSPACATVVAPTTPVPVVTAATVVYVGDTLDGRQVEIRPSATTRFVGDVPAVVQQTVDIAIESGCEGVLAQRDLWATRVDDPVIGDEASVYAQHAQNVADYIRCDAPPITAG